EPSGTIILIDSPPVLELIVSTIKELDIPLETAVFDINYANPSDIKTYLADLITPGLGQLIIDQRSNKVMVTDLPQRLGKIKKLMCEFDESSRQVLITGEIIQISLSDKFQSGIDWEHILRDSKLHGLDFVGKFPLSPTPTVNYGKVSVGTLDSDDYSVILNLMQDYGKVEILSRPQVLAVNKEEARILVGSREPYVTQQQSQAQASTVTSETVEFIDVGVKLKVVPTINKDGFITMKIKPEISSIKDTFTTASGSRIPIVETSETETVVKVKDGAMIMIGGLIKKEHRNSISGLPVLSKIPVLGSLFGNKVKEEKRTELVVFLRPKLVSGDIRKAAEGQ
ncbi:MAG: secretin N-terminal domain-containing protein, partial [Candidatus Omnitrophota bacterium]